MLRSAPSTGFFRQLLSYAASEAAGKASRLLVVISVARTMDAEAIGIAAAALAAGDILKSLTENGVGQRIIAAPAHELEQRCKTARLIFTGWCVGLFALQVAIAAALWLAGQKVLALLLAVLALEYLFMPVGLVQAALAMREGKLHQTAAIAATQVVGANLATALLAVLWPTPFAMVVPRLLAAPVWLVLMRRLRPWRPDPNATYASFRPFWHFGWVVVGVELVKVGRLQADKLIVGALLGAESLGIYYMAFNAGLGLATSFTQAFSIVLFPHLCAATDRAGALRDGLASCLLLLTPLIILQAALAPYYVPVLLGADWGPHAHIVSIMCLAALPTAIWSGTAGWLRAENRPKPELAASALLVAALILNAVLLAPYGLTALASGYVITSAIIMLSASWLLMPANTSFVRKEA